MNHPKKITPTLGIALAALLSSASIVVSAQYQLNGTAKKIGANAYQMTSDKEWQNGSMWFINQLDLSKSFDLIFELNFGSKNDDGADGMTFTLQRQGINAGEAGGGMGAKNIFPALIVEYDTYQNTVNPWGPDDYKDPAYDHITIGRDSFACDHSLLANQLSTPVAALPNEANIEDGKWHSSRIKWDADSKIFSVYFDCILRTTYSGDIVSSIFNGNPLVYYGLTGATGGLFNEQSIRGFHFGKSQKVSHSICIGDSIQVDLSSDEQFSWVPNTHINSDTSEMPIFSPVTTTRYIATVSNCYLSWKDTVDITVHQLPTPSIASQSICAGSPAVFDAGAGYAHYLWSGNSQATTQSTTANTAGNYTCKVTDANGCKASASATLTINPLPDVLLGADTSLCENSHSPIQIFASTTGTTNFSWSTGSTETSIFVEKAGNYWVKNTDPNSSCEASDQITVANICPEIILDFPNVVTANSDGYNDVFQPMQVDDSNYSFISDNINVSSFVVYDRWGILIYSNYADLLPLWDGNTQKGAAAACGTYYYIVQYSTNKGKKHEATGYVTLL